MKKRNNVEKDFNRQQIEKQPCILSCLLMHPEYSWRQPVISKEKPAFVDLDYLQSQVKLLGLTVPHRDAKSFWNIEKWVKESFRGMVERNRSFADLKSFLDVFKGKIAICLDDDTIELLREKADIQLRRVVSNGHLEKFVQVAHVMKCLGQKLTLREELLDLFKTLSVKAINVFTDRKNFNGLRTVFHLADWYGAQVKSNHFLNFLERQTLNPAKSNGQVVVLSAKKNTPNALYLAAIDFIVGR